MLKSPRTLSAGISAGMNNIENYSRRVIKVNLILYFDRWLLNKPSDPLIYKFTTCLRMDHYLLGIAIMQRN